MSSWPDAIFASDLAADVRAEFHDALRFGLPAAEATAAVLSKYRELLHDPREGPVVVMCLAALQMAAGQLHPDTRDAALELIRDRAVLRAWAGGDGARKRELKALLEAFEADLVAAEVMGDEEQSQDDQAPDPAE